MNSTLSVFALILAAAALAVAAFNQTKEVAAPRADSRLGDLQAQVDRIERIVEELSMRRRRAGAGGGAAPAKASGSRDTIPLESDGSRASADSDKRIKEIVDEAVARKTKEVVSELEVKENKKPAFDVLAATLKLSKDQEYAARQELIKGQREAYRILETPTQDGRNLMDDLIEYVARDTLWPGKDHGFGKWFAALVTEKVPGTDETYATQLDATKKSLNAALQKTFNREQYAEYKKWGVNPLEVEEIKGGPGERFNQRVKERLKQLTAQYPNGLPK